MGQTYSRLTHNQSCTSKPLIGKGRQNKFQGLLVLVTNEDLLAVETAPASDQFLGLEHYMAGGWHDIREK